MLNVKKGYKLKNDAVILTKEEYKKYVRVLRQIELVKSYKKDYDLTYRDVVFE